MSAPCIRLVGILVLTVTVFPIGLCAGSSLHWGHGKFSDQADDVAATPQTQSESWELESGLWSSRGMSVEEGKLAEEPIALCSSVEWERQGRTLIVSDWQVLPEGLLFHSYAAGEKEPRFAAQWLWERERGLVWETALGGRMGIVRKGTVGPVNPQGFQIDIEGAAMTRVDPEANADLEAADFRIGFVGTWRYGPWRYKAGYSHLSSHLGDEFLIRNPATVRINYVRDSLLAAVMYDLTDDVQVYAEVAGAWNANGGAEPLELQFGVQYLPAKRCDWRGSPFAAVNGHLRQEFDMGGSISAMAGWMWRGKSDHTYRLGLQHYSGPALQYALFDQYESLTGFGMWMDF